jgi:hypothetical protein
MKKLQQFLLAGLAAILVACPTPIVLPVITTFTATPESLPIGGGSSTLAWSTTNADTLTIDQGVGVVTGTEKAITITATKSYTLTATNSAGSVQKTVTITVATGKPVISTFTATPASLPVGGGSSTLTWAVVGADSLSIDKAVGTVTGTEKAVTVSATTTYTLTATNSLGSETKAVTVTVAQPVEPPANVISGTITPWTRGERIVKGFISAGGVTTNTVTGSFSPAGTFNLDLPNSPSPMQAIPIPSSCSATLTLTPADTKAAFLNQISIITNDDKYTGSLQRSSSTNSTFQTGSKQVQYMFVDKDSTWKGTCVSGGQTQTIDVTLKQGWNTILFELLSANSARIFTGAIPADTIWRFSDSGPSTITSSKTDLDIGDTANLTAKATDNYEYQPSEIDWVSSNTNAIEVSATGVITAKAAGSSTLSAKLKGTAFSSANLSLTVTGFSAEGSTYNIEDASVGTAIRLRYNSTYLSTPIEIPLNIIGPTGWNNNQPLSVTLKANGFENSTVVLSEIPAVTGTYTARRASATTGGVTFTIDATQKISTVKNLRLQASSYYTLQWDEVVANPSQGLIYATDIIDAVTGEVIRSKTDSFGTSKDFYDVNTFDKTRSYKLRVFVQPQSATANTTPFVGISVNSLLLDFRPIVNQIRTRGGTTAGGNAITIDGAFFDINTRVFLGTTEATSITLNGTASMTVTAPAGNVGTVDITLQNARGTSVISDNTKYTYYAISNTNAIQPKNLTRGSNGVIYFLDVISSSSNVLSLLQMSATTAPISLAIPNAAFYDARDMALDESNNVWISFSNKFVKVTPSNTISEVAMPTGVNPAAFVFNAGYIWFLRTDSGKIGKMLPDGTNISEFTVPSSFGSNSFSTSNDFVIGPDGNLWFTQQYGGLGRITPAGAITVLSNVSQSNAKILVYDNALWINSGYSSIQRITADGTVTNTSTCGGINLAVGADNYFWCGGTFATNSAFLNRQIISTTQTNTLAQSIGLGSTTSSQVSEIISDSNGRIWYINGNKVGVLTP